MNNRYKNKEKIVLFSSDLSFKGVPWALLSITRLIDLSKCDIKIITNVEYPKFEEEIIKQCRGALCLGISCITGIPIKTALRISKKVKSHFPNLPIIWGGWQAITLPEITLSSPYVDYICIGRGETVFKEFIDILINKKIERVKQIEGIGYKKKGKITINKIKNFEDLNKYPDFNLDLINWKKYLEVTDYGIKAIRIMTSYGCPNRCGFCCELYSSNRRWKAFSADRIISLLIKIKQKADFDSLIIGDSNFFVDENRVINFCNGLLSGGFNIKFGSVNGTTDVLSKYKKSTWKLLKKSGLYSILIGAESADDSILITIGKTAMVKHTYELNKICKRYSIQLIASTILGIPTEKYQKNDKKIVLKEEFKGLAEMYKNLFKINPGIFFVIFSYTPLPSTPLYEKSLKLGFVPPKNIEEWSNYDLSSAHFNWIDNSIMKKIKTLNLVSLILSKNIRRFSQSTPFLFNLIAFPVLILLKGIFWLRFYLNNYEYFIDIFLIEQGILFFHMLNRKFKFINLIDTSGESY